MTTSNNTDDFIIEYLKKNYSILPNEILINAKEEKKDSIAEKVKKDLIEAFAKNNHNLYCSQ